MPNTGHKTSDRYVWGAGKIAKKLGVSSRTIGRWAFDVDDRGIPTHPIGRLLLVDETTGKLYCDWSDVENHLAAEKDRRRTPKKKRPSRKAAAKKKAAKRAGRKAS